jgi:hypothetical protein
MGNTLRMPRTVAKTRMKIQILTWQLMYVPLSKYIYRNIKRTSEIYFKQMNTINECTPMNGTNINVFFLPLDLTQSHLLSGVCVAH